VLIAIGSSLTFGLLERHTTKKKLSACPYLLASNRLSFPIVHNKGGATSEACRRAFLVFSACRRSFSALAKCPPLRLNYNPARLGCSRTVETKTAVGHTARRTTRSGDPRDTAVVTCAVHVRDRHPQLVGAVSWATSAIQRFAGGRRPSHLSRTNRTAVAPLIDQYPLPNLHHGGVRRCRQSP
jgi:hypothetical protein